MASPKYRLSLTEDELDAVLMGLNLVRQQEDGDFYESAESALSKIAGTLSKTLSKTLPKDEKPPETRTPAGKPTFLSLIHRAMSTEHKLQLRYVDKKQRETDRMVWPVTLTEWGADDVVVAWCEKRKDFRHFRIDRIVKVQVLDAAFPRRHRLLLAERRAQESSQEY